MIRASTSLLLFVGVACSDAAEMEGMAMPMTGQIALQCAGRTEGHSVSSPEFSETIYVDLDRKTYCTDACPEARPLARADEAGIIFRDRRMDRHPYLIDFAQLDLEKMTYTARYAMNARARIDRRTTAACSIVHHIPEDIAEKLANASNR